MAPMSVHPLQSVRIPLACVLLASLTGCAQAVAPTATPAPATSLATVCDPENVGQVRTVEGFFIFPDEIVAGDALTLILSAGPGGVEPYVHVTVPVGTGPNQVEAPPADASDQDLRVHTGANEVADMSRQVRVGGLVTAGDMGDGTTCYLKNPAIALAADVKPTP